VLEDGPAHMVAELPNAPFCTVDATAYRRKQMAATRDKVRICAKARVVGVAFWDRPHNVTGRAPKKSRILARWSSESASIHVRYVSPARSA
jgi:hypothetical protein